MGGRPRWPKQVEGQQYGGGGGCPGFLLLKNGGALLSFLFQTFF